MDNNNCNAPKSNDTIRLILAPKSNDTIHLIFPTKGKKRKHKHSRVPEDTKNKILMELINEYEVCENGILSLKNGAFVQMSKKYDVDRGTISTLWRKKRKEPFYMNMQNVTFGKNNDHIKKKNDLNRQNTSLPNHKNKMLKEANSGECFDQKMEGLELKLKEQKDTTDNMLNDMKLEFERVVKTGGMYKILYDTLKKKKLSCQMKTKC